MPKTATPAKARKPAVVEDDDEEEEEVVVVSTKKKATPAPAKSATNGKATAKAAVTKKAVKEVDDEASYTPNPNSMRDFIMRAMKRGGTSAQIKKRAASYAEKKGVDALADAKAYKNFDVAYFAKFLNTKGFAVEIDEEADSYTLSA
jgi:hypothetical protein